LGEFIFWFEMKQKKKWKKEKEKRISKQGYNSLAFIKLTIEENILVWPSFEFLFWVNLFFGLK
jgi:hypothetical protein